MNFLFDCNILSVNRMMIKYNKLLGELNLPDVNKYFLNELTMFIDFNTHDLKHVALSTPSFISLSNITLWSAEILQYFAYQFNKLYLSVGENNHHTNFQCSRLFSHTLEQEPSKAPSKCR